MMTTSYGSCAVASVRRATKDALVAGLREDYNRQISNVAHLQAGRDALSAGEIAKAWRDDEKRERFRPSRFQLEIISVS